MYINVATLVSPEGDRVSFDKRGSIAIVIAYQLTREERLEATCDTGGEDDASDGSVEDQPKILMVNVREFFGADYGHHNQVVDLNRQGAIVHAIFEWYEPLCGANPKFGGSVCAPATVLFSLEIHEISCPECLILSMDWGSELS